MLDIGWSELLVIGVVALVVVGPKDLPVMFKTLGRFTAKARQMGREFSRAMEAAADETGVKDVANDLRNATSPAATGIDRLKEAADKFEKWDPRKAMANPVKAATGVMLGAGMSGSQAPAAPAPAPVAEAAPPVAPTASPAPAGEAKSDT